MGTSKSNNQVPFSRPRIKYKKNKTIKSTTVKTKKMPYVIIYDKNKKGNPENRKNARKDQTN